MNNKRGKRLNKQVRGRSKGRVNRNQKFSLTAKEIEDLKLNSTRQAVSITQLFPLLVLRDEFGFGEKRLKRFLAKYQETLEAYNEGYVDLKDIAKMLEEEVNVKI